MTPYRCHHGLTLNEPCRNCELETARAFVEHWGGPVDEARKVIAESEQTTEEQR